MCVCECRDIVVHMHTLSYRNAHLARLPGRQRKISLQGLPASFHVTTSHLQRQDSLGLFFLLPCAQRVHVEEEGLFLYVKVLLVARRRTLPRHLSPLDQLLWTS